MLEFTVLTRQYYRYKKNVVIYQWNKSREINQFAMNLFPFFLFSLPPFPPSFLPPFLPSFCVSLFFALSHSHSYQCHCQYTNPGFFLKNIFLINIMNCFLTIAVFFFFFFFAKIKILAVSMWVYLDYDTVFLSFFEMQLCYFYN